ncbi:MAG TPA: hypothetical protein VGB88_03875 [Alphaproteobacteria bacterium]
MAGPPADTAAAHARIAALDLAPDRPLIVSDADEVLFVFMAAFEGFLDRRGHYFDWMSFALDGNVRSRADDTALPRAAVAGLLDAFFEHHTASLEPVPGAAAALAGLSARAQILVLSNIPAAQAPIRRAALSRHGMDYPLIANTGPKGPVVEALAEAVAAPVFFLDDGPRHHASVARHAPRVRRLHLIADTRLADLLGPVSEAHHAVRHWPEARALIESELAAAGY